ncbi:hypothetical protein SD70_16020 [Gordoniibacillus kamchatkensis]|uniref:SH3b domain-containing protein n=2 Tax=Gordoniibacillus kamchatkensis TaxID=1590651 RepID=A0ABR5AGD4_9BACL|nr:hypothetical protein SD70_16020 [Paenibacillus sp. VKM B-2647]
MWLVALTPVLCLGLAPNPAQATNAYPATVTLGKLTDTYEAPSEKDPSDVKLTPQEVYITGMKQNDKNADYGWYRIATWRGEKWVKLTEADFNGQEQLVASDVALLAETELYDEPKSGTGTGIMLGKQTVHAEAISGSYLKIGTWLGSKWIRISGDMLLDVQAKPQELALAAAVTPVFARPDGLSELVMELSPQTVHAFEQKDNWYHIRTSGWDAWINPDIAVPAGVSEQTMSADVQQKTVLYAYPSFDAKPLGVIAPQQVNVSGTVGGWKRIDSDWVGEAWLYNVPDPDQYAPPPATKQSPGDRKWQFRQTEAAGAVGKEFPVNVWLESPNGPIKPGTKLQLGVSMTNFSRNTVRLDAPAQFAIDIVRLAGGEEQTVWSALLPETATSITGQGNYSIEGYTWNQTDANGDQVPQGDYVVRLRLIRPVTLGEDGVEWKHTLQFRSYFVNVPIHILLPAGDCTPRLDTAKELFHNYLTSQKRSSVPASRRIADYRIQDVRLARESYDDFTFTVTYEVKPASDSFKPAAAGQSQWDGLIRYDKREFHAIRQGDEYRLDTKGISP